ncbi:hypothetical protein [Carnobacterium divergens]|uniref:hypothetical protein n=1 Tax=Carnobacterium divergens TaxID=2748 RepID=UPI0039B0BC49
MISFKDDRGKCQDANSLIIIKNGIQCHLYDFRSVMNAALLGYVSIYCNCEEYNGYHYLGSIIEIKILEEVKIVSFVPLEVIEIESSYTFLKFEEGKEK